MDVLSLLVGVFVGSVSSYVGIWLKIKFGEQFSMLFELMKTSKEIFTVNPVLPSNMDFEVLESVTKKSDENVTPISNTDKPKKRTIEEEKDKV